MTQPEHCHWDNDRGLRVTRRHIDDCDQPGCDGCAPCLERHCPMPRCATPSRHLGEHDHGVCARCVGAVRTNLDRIEDLMLLAPIDAAETGHEIGPSAVLAGPIADRQVVDQHRRHAHDGGLCTCTPGRCPDRAALPAGPTCEQSYACTHYVCRRHTGRRTCPAFLAWLDDTAVDDERHPLWVLGWWDLLVTEHLGLARRTSRITVDDAAGFLRRNLTELARDHGTADFAFDELARDIAACREHVEEVLALAPHVQRGAPCPTCATAGRKARPLERTYSPGTTDARDQWTCPRRDCDATFTLDEYARAVYLDYLANATALTAEQMLAQYRIPKGSLRTWAAPTRRRVDGELVESAPRLQCTGRDSEGRKLYPVKDALRLRDAASTDARSA